MKKILGIMLAIVFFAAPALTFAQVDAAAGSIKMGVHLDVSYLLSGESNEDPDEDEIGWTGYDSVNLQDVIIELNGKVGDRISFLIIQALVVENWTANVVDPVAGVSGPVIDIHKDLAVPPIPLEAWINFKIIDQLGFKFGKQITPTLVANTGAHVAAVIHTVNPPLIAQNSFGLSGLASDSSG